MKANTRLAGHTLPDEGRVRDESGRLNNCFGSTQCSCGEKSPDLSGTPARRRWHREHKENARGN